jgi:hypothetical protein
VYYQTLKPYHNYSDSLLSFSIKPLLFLAQMFDTAKSNRESVNHLIKFSDSMQSNSNTRCIFQLLHYLLFTHRDAPSLPARHPAVSLVCFILLREECSLGSLQHTTVTIIYIIFFQIKKKAF